MTIEITYLHDCTVQLNGGTFGLAQMNNADPHCFVYFQTWIATLPFSLMTCVLSFAGLLAGILSAVVWLLDRPTRPNHALKRTAAGHRVAHRTTHQLHRTADAGSLSLGR
jgi:hypothetical protein